jgi:hypothetical protein
MASGVIVTGTGVTKWGWCAVVTRRGATERSWGAAVRSWGAVMRRWCALVVWRDVVAGWGVVIGRRGVLVAVVGKGSGIATVMG